MNVLKFECQTCRGHGRVDDPNYQACQGLYNCEDCLGQGRTELRTDVWKMVE